MKAKYAGIIVYALLYSVLCNLLDGQKIATRLSRRITVVGKLLEKALSQYNSDLSQSCCISWSTVVDPSSSFYSDGVFCDNSQVSAIVKSQAMQLYQLSHTGRSLG